MYSEIVSAPNTRIALQEAAKAFSPHPHNRFNDTYLKHQAKLEPGKHFTVMIAHSSGSMIIEKTLGGAVRAISETTGADYTAMLALGMQQLEEHVPTKKIRVRKKPVKKVVASEEDVQEAKVKKAAPKAKAKKATKK